MAETGGLSLKDPGIEVRMGRGSEFLRRLHCHLQFDRHHDWLVARCGQSHDQRPSGCFWIRAQQAWQLESHQYQPDNHYLRGSNKAFSYSLVTCCSLQV